MLRSSSVGFSDTSAVDTAVDDTSVNSEALHHAAEVVVILAEQSGNPRVIALALELRLAVAGKAKEVCSGNGTDGRRQIYQGTDFDMDSGRVFENEIYNTYISLAIDRAFECIPEESFVEDENREVMRDIVHPILRYCIREYDRGFHGATFQDWLEARIFLSMRSLRNSHSKSRPLTAQNAIGIVRRTAEVHRTLKNQANFYRKTHNENRENNFAEWCESNKIDGQTHEERVFAATIHFALDIQEFLLTLDVFGPDNDLLYLSIPSLHQYLWTYNPQMEGDKFLDDAKRYVFQILKKKSVLQANTRFPRDQIQNVTPVKVGAEQDSNGFLSEGSSSSHAASFITEEKNPHSGMTVLSEVTALEETDSQESASTLVDDETVVKNISELQVEAESVDTSDHSLEATNAGGVEEVRQSTRTSEIFSEEDLPEMAEERRKEMIGLYVRAHVKDGENIWDYNVALEKLEKFYCDDALHLARIRLIQKHKIKKPKIDTLSTAAGEALTMAIHSFNPPNAEGERFRGHLQGVINANIFELYTKHK